MSDAEPTPAPQAPPATPATASRFERGSAWRTGWHLVAPVVWVLLALLLLLAALAGLAQWLLRSEGGSQWLLQRVPGLQVQGLRGAVLSEEFSFDRLVLRDIGGLKQLQIDAVQVRGVQWQWLPRGGAFFAIQAQTLHADRVEVLTRSTPGPATPFSSLRWPLQVAVADLRANTVQINQLPPFTAVQGQAELGAERGSLHRFRGVQTVWDRMALQGQAQIGTSAPFVLQVDLAGSATPGSTGRPWAARVQAQGPLERFELQARLRGSLIEGTPEKDLPMLDVQAQILPYAPWSLGRLSASTQALDLSDLASFLPTTRLSGTAQVQSQAMDQPASAELKLENANPGRWNEGRLPLRSGELLLRAVPREHQRIEILRFDLQLAAGAQSAGRWWGQGEWTPEALSLDGRVADLRPQLLDGRAAKLVASGPLQLQFGGLPWPDPAQAKAPTPWSIEAKGKLEGRLDIAPQPVQAQLDVLLSAERIELRQLLAQAGSASARLEAQARPVGGQWNVSSSGSMNEVDPLLWWPGAEGSAWRQGPHRLSGQWQFDLRLPRQPERLAAVALAQTTVGSGRLTLQNSQLAGVPLALDLRLENRPDNPAAPSALRGELLLGGNRVQIDAQADPLGPGRADRLHATIEAPLLAQLAPLARLWPDASEWAPREGSINATLQAAGRWPDIRSEGQAQASKVQFGELALAQASTRWRLDSALDQPLAATVELAGVRLAQQVVQSLSAELQGTLRQHRLQLTAALPLAPPAWAQSLFALPGAHGTRVKLLADGQWAGDGSGGGSWRGRVDELLLGRGVPAGSAAPASPNEWLEARNLRAEVRLSPQGGVGEVRAEAGSARIGQQLTLRWDDVRVAPMGDRADFRLRAQIDPFAAAPLLRRWQPALAFSGDLQLAARVDIDAQQRFAADVVFERRSGDLLIEDNAGNAALGLNELKLAVAARDGRWTFTPQFSGRALGTIGGQLALNTSPERRWPDNSAAMQGSIEAKVSDLGIWSAWVPPGWRLAGTVTTQARLGGTLGAPQFTGRLLGEQLAVRNLLQGVDVSGGDVDIDLQGTSARIQRFSLRAGEGRLTATGTAEFGATPNAKVRLQAERLRVLGRVDRQLTMSGQAQLALTGWSPDRIELDGQLKVDDGLFDLARRDAPTLDEDVVLRGDSLPIDTDTAEPSRPQRRDLRVALQLDLGDKLRVRGRGLDAALAGQLRITTPGGRLALNGIVRAVDGTYAAYAQKLEIERGVLLFNGPPENPNLDILALRPNIDARVGVAIAGSLVNPRVRLVSDPEMSDADKLSWLVLGRPSDGLQRADTALLQRAAVALLAGEGEAPTDTLLRQLGIDDLSLRQQNDGDVRETVITLGKQLSRRWYVGYERGVNATSGTWQLIYRIAQRFTLRAQSGHENALDLIWVWRIDDPALLALPGLTKPPQRTALPPARAASR